MDTSKIISVMMTNPGYYDDLTDQSKIVNRGAPLLVAPTSAGTGSEATPNAIVLIPEKKLKVGVVHPYFLPCRVLLDPELTKSLPKSVTASTGVDAFCHCIETYISRKTNPFARVFGLKGIELISKYLRRAYEDGSDMEARENMLLAAFYGGVAITASSTVAVHALSYPLGGTYRHPARRFERDFAAVRHALQHGCHSGRPSHAGSGDGAGYHRHCQRARRPHGRGAIHPMPRPQYPR